VPRATGPILNAPGPAPQMSSSGPAASAMPEPSWCLHARRKPERVSLPVRSGPTTEELLTLRAKVAQLQACEHQNVKDRNTLQVKKESLQSELRRTLEQNRRLATELEGRKQFIEQASAREEAAARETALTLAKDLFRKMLAEASNSDTDVKGCSGEHQSQNRRGQRNSGKRSQCALGTPLLESSRYSANVVNTELN